MPHDNQSIGVALANVHEVMLRLRASDGCPWDRQQTQRTLRAYLLEETYELLEAMDAANADAHCEELGDLFFQIVFQAQIAAERGEFDLADVAESIRHKLVNRHPHVFDTSEKELSPSQVRDNWERIKRKEKKGRGALAGVPKELPALLRAVRVGEKAAAVGFDWPDAVSVRSKINEELDELEQALAQKDMQHAERELGDLLFATCSYARHLGLMPEDALRGALDRFSERFAVVEAMLTERNVDAHEVDAAQLENYWQEAKRQVG